jgi:ribonuclease Z
MFDLVFLGTSAAVPSIDRGSPASLVICGPERFLIDCGEGTQRQLMRAKLGFRGLGHVLLTHLHLDHVAGLAGFLATRQLFRIDRPIEIIGSAETVGFVGRFLADTVGSGRHAGYRLCAVQPGPLFSHPGWRLGAFRVAHRGTQSLGYLFEAAARRPLLADRLDALGVPHGPERAALARGEPVVLGDGRRIAPEMVQGPSVTGAKLAVIGDAEETSSLVEPVRRADTLVIEATFLERDAALARARGHLTAAAGAGLARKAEVGELLLTHISGRYRPAEILAEASALFPETRVVADFDRVWVGPRPDHPAPNLQPAPPALAEEGREGLNF